jgi:CBS domain-containing protein
LRWRGSVALSRYDGIAGIMEPSESNSNEKQPLELKRVKEILEPATPLQTKASVESALDELQAQESDSAPVTDREGTLVGKVSKDQMIRGVGGRGHDPKTSLVEPEVEKEGAPYCYENETIGKADEVMREVKVDEVSVVSEKKNLLGKATLDAIEKETKREG